MSVVIILRFESKVRILKRCDDNWLAGDEVTKSLIERRR